MSNAPDMVTISVVIPRRYVDRIDNWAEKLGHSRSKLARLILEEAVETHGWSLDMLTSHVGLKIVDMIRLVAEKEAPVKQAGTVPAA